MNNINGIIADKIQKNRNIKNIKKNEVRLEQFWILNNETGT